jgi:hypothetical protein
MGAWDDISFLVTRRLDSADCRSGRGEEPSGKKVVRLMQTAESFAPPIAAELCTIWQMLRNSCRIFP